MFGRVTFYPSLFYNIALERLAYRKWYTRLDDTIVLGALPWRHLVPEVSYFVAFSRNNSDFIPFFYLQLQLVEKEKVGAVVSMNESFELKYGVPTEEEWKGQGVHFLQLSTPDIFHAPTQDNLDRGVEFIRKFEGSGRSVYVHCKAGRTRSATLVGCYLMQKHNWDAETAVDFMKSKRSHVLLHSPQWNAMRMFFDRHIKPMPSLAAAAGP